MSKPRVGILMGSDSDLETMKQAAAACAEFGVMTEMRVLSARRSTRGRPLHAVWESSLPGPAARRICREW